VVKFLMTGDHGNVEQMSDGPIRSRATYCPYLRAVPFRTRGHGIQQREGGILSDVRRPCDVGGPEQPVEMDLAGSIVTVTS